MRFACTFLFFLYISPLYTNLVSIYFITYIVPYFHINDDEVCFSSPTSTYVLSFLSLHTCLFMYAIFISVSHMMR